MLEVSEIIVIKEESEDVIELIDISKTVKAKKLQIPINQLKYTDLLDIENLLKLEVVQSENKVTLEIDPNSKKNPVVIEINCNPEPCSTAPPHPKKKLRSLPWKSLGPSSASFTAGEYPTKKLTAQELLDDKTKHITDNCKKFSKSKIKILSDHTILNKLIIRLKILILYLPFKIWRTIEIPFESTYDYLKKCISDLFQISTNNSMFIFLNPESKKIFLNSPGKLENEKKADEEFIKKKSFMDFINFEHPELYFINNDEDNWYISIKIKEISEWNEYENYPVCVGGRLMSPIQGISFGKFSKILQVLVNQNHQKYQKYFGKFGEWKNKKFNKLEVDFPSLNVFNGRIRIRIEDLLTVNAK